MISTRSHFIWNWEREGTGGSDEATNRNAFFGSAAMGKEKIWT